MLQLPSDLKCIHCTAKRFSTTTNEVMSDYKWRRLKCNHCGKATWWGEPHIEVTPMMFAPDDTRLHMVLNTHPKLDRDTGKTSNIAYALPAGATNRMLLDKAIILNTQRQVAARFMFEHKKQTLQELTYDEKLELKRMLDEVEENRGLVLPPLPPRGIAYPPQLKCEHCGCSVLKNKSSIGPASIIKDYYWRAMQCNDCGKYTWWGVPTPERWDTRWGPIEYDETAPQLVMKKTPISYLFRTKNIQEAREL